MNNKKNNPRQKMVCFCYSISEQEIIDAINKGASSLMDVRRETYANTGCGGCREDVKRLLNKYVKKRENEKNEE